MKITKKDVEHCAKLARLALSEEEKEKFRVQLDTILDYMEKLNKLNTDGIKPTSHVIDLKNVFREDETRQGDAQEEILKNSPEREDRFFKVKKVIE